MARVVIRHIHKSFGETPVLKGVSLAVDDGEFVTLVGPSGCGKSTLLRIIAGLEHQDQGSICIGAAAVDDLPPKRRDVAMVFQSYALYPYMSVAENIALPLVMRRLGRWQRLPVVGRFIGDAHRKRAGITAAVGEVAAALDIAHLLERRPAQLSGGQRQRVALGRAMVRHPQVFLMDEPLSNLDAKLRVQMRAEIAQLHRRLAATFIYVTHDQAEAMTMSDRVAVMIDGELLQVAAPQELYADPAELRVAEFIGSPKINVLPGRVRADGAVETLGLTLPLAVSDDVAGATIAVAVRAEGFEPVRADGRPHLRGTISHLEHLGPEAFVHVGLKGAAETVLLRFDPERGRELRVGGTIAFRPMADKALLFDSAGRRLRTTKPVLREAVVG
jgi:multiple sugar transport system ATP-binding protein